jgi:S-(hydroxymethyl)glutathione dehydrogenase/alcohol dehydrogenase
MRSVRAAVIEQAGAEPSVEHLDLADLEAGEVLIRVAATGVCHTDLSWADGHFGKLFPSVPGHEIAGVVESVGAAVTLVKPGDHVVVSVISHCGHCFHCEQGEPALCLRRSGQRARLSRGGEPVTQAFGTGGFADATIVREWAAIQIPRDVPLELAAVMGCAVATGFGAALNVARVEAGSSVLVLGCGAIGVATIMAARLAGAERIVAVDPNDARAQAALGFGATDALAPHDDALRELLPTGFDVAFEAAGEPAAAELAIRATRQGGTIVLIGVPRAETPMTLDLQSLVISQKRICGCNMGNVRPNVDFDAYFRLYRRGLLDLEALVTATVPLDEIATAFERARRGDGIRTVVTMG